MHRSSNRRPSRRLTALALLALLAVPPLSFAPTATAAPGQGWSLPAVTSGAAGIYTRADFAAGQNGVVFAIWDEPSNTTATVYTNRYVPSIGWGTPVRMTTVYGRLPSIATDQNGNAFASWMELNASFGQWGPVGMFYLVDSGWVGRVNLTNNYAKTGWTFADTLFDGKGTAFVVERTTTANPNVSSILVSRVGIDGAVDREFACAYNWLNMSTVSAAAYPGGGVTVAFDGSVLAGPSTITTCLWDQYYQWNGQRSVGYGTAPDIAVEANGVAHLVWLQNLSGSFLQYAWRYGTTYWNGPTAIAGAPATTGAPSIALTDAGLGVIVFSAYDGQRFAPFALHGSRDVGWSYPVGFNEAVVLTQGALEVDVDRSGNAAVVFASPSGATTILRASEVTYERWTGGTVATESTMLGGYNVSVGSLTPIQVQSLGPGMMWAGWSESGPLPRARFNRFSAPDTVAPYIEITSPFDGLITTEARLEFQGRAEPFTTVKVGGALVQVNADGWFAGSASLSLGTNYIDAVAVDASGNQGSSGVLAVRVDESVNRQFEQDHAAASGLIEPQRFTGITDRQLYDVQTAAVPGGGAIALYRMYGMTSPHVYASRFDSIQGWGTPTQLDIARAQDISDLGLSANGAGDAIAVWRAQDPVGGLGGAHVYAAAFDHLAGVWTTTVRLDAQTYSSDPRVAAGADGRFLVAWTEMDLGSQWHAFAAWATASGGFESTAAADALPGSVLDIAVAAGAAGQATIVAFLEVAGGGYISLLNYTEGPGWNGGRYLYREDYYGYGLAASADAGNNLSIAWFDYPAPAYVPAVETVRFLQSSGWTAFTPLNRSASGGAVRMVAIADGSAFLAFALDAASGYTASVVSRAAPGGSFGPGQVIGAFPDGPAAPAVVTTDLAGRNLLAVFSALNESTYEQWIYFSTWTPGGAGWSAPETVAWPSPSGSVGAGILLDDGTQMVIFGPLNTTGYHFEILVERHKVANLTAPPLLVTAPAQGAHVTVPTVRVAGSTDAQAVVRVNGLRAGLEADGSFAMDVVLVDGANTITITSLNAAGNTATAWVNVTFDSPERRRIEDLEAQNAQLAADLASANATLLASLAAQNASLAAQIAATNASLLASLASQNDDLLASLATTNSGLLAQIASQNATLWAKLTDDNGRLWTSLNATAAKVDSPGGATAGAADQGAGTLAMAGLGLALVAVLLGALCIAQIRRMNAPAAPPEAKPAEAPSPVSPQDGPPPK